MSDISNLMEKRQLWIEALAGQDPSSIQNQLREASWKLAVWQLLLEAEAISPVENDILKSFVFGCFVDSQLLSVRRLGEAGGDKPAKLSGRNEVFSLPALLNDIKNNIKLLTRKNLFKVEGLTYDIDMLHVQRQEFISNQMAAGKVNPCATTDFHDVQRRHEQIDELAGLTEAERSPTDCIKEDTLAELIDIVKTSTGGFAIYANKFIAHAATPDSRKTNHPLLHEFNFDLKKFLKTHTNLCKVAIFINNILLNRRDPLTFPLLDSLETLHIPLVAQSDVPALEIKWNSLRSGYRNLKTWEITELLPR